MISSIISYYVCLFDNPVFLYFFAQSRSFRKPLQSVRRHYSPFYKEHRQPPFSSSNQSRIPDLCCILSCDSSCLFHVLSACSFCWKSGSICGYLFPFCIHPTIFFVGKIRTLPAQIGCGCNVPVCAANSGRIYPGFLIRKPPFRGI